MFVRNSWIQSALETKQLENSHFNGALVRKIIELLGDVPADYQKVAATNGTYVDQPSAYGSINSDPGTPCSFYPSSGFQRSKGSTFAGWWF